MQGQSIEPVLSRGRWKGAGFILAASGSAIGLGNIVFFPANAYRFGGGGFYLAYWIAFFLVGIPLLVLELGLGHQQRKAYPGALREVAGAPGEFLGWWALVNTSFITLYYVAILGWVIGMCLGALGPLWEADSSLPGFAVQRLANPQGFFFHMVSQWGIVMAIVAVWVMNGLIVRRGTQGIERAVKIFIPAMWILMLILLGRGLTLPGGAHGVWNLFTPSLESLLDVSVWQGAFSQIFFTLSIGFGVMTAYASYLPPQSDQVNNATLIACLNCSFEIIAGGAMFAILFAFAVVPKASTLSMTFFIVPQGIRQLPGGESVVGGFGVLFFLLLLLAGLSSTVSLVEAAVSALVDKFALARGKLVCLICFGGAVGSSLFALPQIVDPGLHDNGTLGLTLLDLVDHWAFGYGLLLVGLSQCLLLGRRKRIERIRRGIEASSSWRLTRLYELLIGRLVPAVLVLILVSSLSNEIEGGLYGSSYASHFIEEWTWLPALPSLALLTWLVLPAGVAFFLTFTRRVP